MSGLHRNLSMIFKSSTSTSNQYQCWPKESKRKSPTKKKELEISSWVSWILKQPKETWENSRSRPWSFWAWLIWSTWCGPINNCLILGWFQMHNQISTIPTISTCRASISMCRGRLKTMNYYKHSIKCRRCTASNSNVNILSVTANDWTKHQLNLSVNIICHL